MLSIIDLPEVLRRNIWSYFGPCSNDTLALAATCRLLLHDTEALSEDELKKMMEKHDVDNDILVRVGCQIAAEGAHKQAAAGHSALHCDFLTVISHRRRLRSARRTHLYSLGTDPSQVYAGVLSLALHPDGKTLICGGHGKRGDPTILSLWDIPSKTRVRSFLGHERYVDKCFFVAGRVVSFAWEESNLRIWSINGTCEHSVEVEGLEVTASEHEIFITGGDDTGIRVVDVCTGEITRSVPHPASNLLQLGGRLLAFNDSFFYEDFEEERNLPSLSVLDKKSLTELSRLERAIHYNAVDTNGQGQVVALSAGTGQIDVLNLEHDELVLLRSFDVDNEHRDWDWRRGLFKLHQSHVYVFCARAYDGSAPFCGINVYNIFTGCLERQLSFPKGAFGYFPECMVITDKEILIGCNLGDGSLRKGYTIKAYAL